MAGLGSGSTRSRLTQSGPKPVPFDDCGWPEASRGLTSLPIPVICSWSTDLTIVDAHRFRRLVDVVTQFRGHLIMKLTSNTILITGGASGIGYELTRQLTALGNTILITGRDQAKMDRAKAAFPKIHTFRSDVSDPQAIAALYEKVTKQFPELNILINNAGIMREINVHDKAGSLEDITREIEINLSGPIRMVKQFLPHLKTKSEAAIMNVSSGLAFVPLPISPVYCATKAGLHSFTESLRVQLKNTKVKVFDLAPPATQTELLGDFNFEDMKGVSIMKVEDMVKVAVKGMQTDRFEIRPGQANQLKIMSRVAPGFILKQMSRSVDRMLRTQN